VIHPGTPAKVTQCDCPNANHRGLQGEVSDIGSRRVLVEFGGGQACAALSVEELR
jgi:hypothetical protein